MKNFTASLLAGLLATSASLFAAVPFDPDEWPSVADPNKTVHFVSTDNSFTPPGGGWSSSLSILSGGDQMTSAVTLRSRAGLKVLGNYLNTADSAFTEWADNGTIDILMQVYGDDAVLGGTGQPRNFNFLLGTLPELVAPVGGQIPVAARNQKWNWVLFRVANGTRLSDGTRFVGSIPGNAPPGSQFGGVNGTLYTINQGGDAFVLKASPKFEVLATNSLGEATIASMAVSNGDLFVRTHKALWCFRESRK